MTVQTIQEEKRRKRPFGLYVIVALELFIAFSLAVGLLILRFVDSYLYLLVRHPIFFTWFGWALVGALLLASLGMLLLNRWGWALSMILAGIALAFSIWNYFQGEPYFLNMAIYLVIVFYLNQREVQSAFKRRSPAGGAA